jgi:hypothetical protein
LFHYRPEKPLPEGAFVALIAALREARETYERSAMVWQELLSQLHQARADLAEARGLFAGDQEARRGACRARWRRQAAAAITRDVGGAAT